MSKKHTVLTVLIGLVAAAVMVAATMPPSSHARKWQAGKGWGWVWGKDDEVGALNEMTDASRLAALKLVRKGTVYDLGLSYDRTSYKWPGHSPGEIIMFRSPDGVKSQKDIPGVIRDNPSLTAWHSCALFINDNVATQIDGLGHATQGKDNHWYNGFKESDSSGDWGIRRCDATNIPPIVARGIMIDVAAYKGMKALPSNYEITPADLRGALRKQGTTLRFGDVVLVRTGTTQFWGTAGSDHETIDRHDSAGINLDSARWLVEQKGAIMVGGDTSGVEYKPTAADNQAYREKYGSFMPVHNYLLIEQGVHIAEFHALEELSRDRVYEFTYVCTVNKIRGTVAGFALRPIAII